MAYTGARNKSYPCIKLILSFIPSKSCAIPDPRNEWLYLTGQADLSSGISRQVSKYSGEGFLQDLPPLKTGRKEHACSGYYNEEDNFVLLVAGGTEDHNYLTSTEIFEVGASSEWEEVSPLPSRLYEARAATVNNNIYLLGWYSVNLSSQIRCSQRDTL